jgi:hypothetical protein
LVGLVGWLGVEGQEVEGQEVGSDGMMMGKIVVVGGKENAPLISSPHLLLTRAKNISFTCASCDADSGNGLRDGMGRRSACLPPSAMAAIHCSEPN